VQTAPVKIREKKNEIYLAVETLLEAIMLLVIIILLEIKIFPAIKICQQIVQTAPVKIREKKMRYYYILYTFVLLLFIGMSSKVFAEGNASANSSGESSSANAVSGTDNIILNGNVTENNNIILNNNVSIDDNTVATHTNSTNEEDAAKFTSALLSAQNGDCAQAIEICDEIVNSDNAELSDMASSLQEECLKRMLIDALE
ncbi:hypothetical protein VU05_04430, partial [Desulfobulbus sp. F1]|nr:hypothetical protein [Desulfobulbus sp. F1]